MTKITEEDLNSCWNPAYHTYYLSQILNGEYKLEHAIDDIRSLIGSKYDSRINDETGDKNENINR